MLSRIFFILTLLGFASCNSYLSIEKRKYMEGYHVEWYSKKDVMQSLQSEFKEQSKEILEGKTLKENLILSTCADSSQNNIEIVNSKSHILFSMDTLPKKNTGKKHDAPRKDDERRDVGKREPKLNTWAVVGFVFGVFTFSLVLFGSLAFIIPAVLATVFSMIGLSKEKGKGYAFAGLLLSIVSALIFLFLIGAVG